MRAASINLLVALLLTALPLSAYTAFNSGTDLNKLYAEKVDRKLNLPDTEIRYYAELLKLQLQYAGLSALTSQYILLVDRNTHVQASLLFWLDAEQQPHFIGASPVSTGKWNGYLYFETPLGIFDHSTKNPDFRSEGTLNEQGLLGYGAKGMRVFDFGWVTARKTWVAEMGEMRLQIHATDPVYLETRLGSAQSMGCVRIPASLNVFLDHYGILDADYEANPGKKAVKRILAADRESTPWPGRYLAIVDSRRDSRPEWSPKPLFRNKPKKKNSEKTG